MRKIAIFVEGHSELIFLHHFLPLVLGWDKISIEFLELYANKINPVSYKYMNKDAETHFCIFNVRNDERVLSTIKDTEKGLIRLGYDKIIALRDMYSEKYCKRSPRRIDENVTRAFIESAHKEIAKMSEPAKIKMHFAIMELEAWFLGMYNMFERLNPALSIDDIESELGFNLSTIDPQTKFFKPTDIVSNILQLISWQYRKSEHDIESICSIINTNDFSNAFENGRCNSFKNFYDEILH